MRATWAISVLCAVGCTTPTAPVGPDAESDAGLADAGPPRPHDAGPHDARVTTDHCRYEPLPVTAHAGGVVTDAPIWAGAAERDLHVPLGGTLGGYTTRSVLGGEGRIDDRDAELAGSFAPSIGIETRPRARAIVISTGHPGDFEETLVLVKADLAVSSAAILRAVEQRLPPELAGKVVFATSHSHGTFADYVPDALQVAFGPFRSQVLDAIVEDLVAVVNEALAARRSAVLGVASTTSFDVDGEVSRDRRSANDALPGGHTDDTEAVVIRIDGTDGSPIAVIPIFGIHGTILDGDNAIVTTDAPGAIERVLEEHFASRVVVMHLQGAGGDTSPVGLEAAINCPTGAVLCQNFARAETVGRRALPELVSLYEAAGAASRSSLELEVVTRTVRRGPDPDAFVVRGGALRYAPWDGVTPGDGRVFGDDGQILSPIDEFNAPYGAALCSTTGRDRALVPMAQIPGSREPSLASTPYPTCNRIEALVDLFRAGLRVETTEAPGCDSTRATLSAVRIGDYYLLTLPGEPMVIGRDRMRQLAHVPPDRLIVVGYAQDHQGYLLTAEDWLAGGYEPTITFWGPLDGEQVMEQSVALLDLVTTAARENAADGSDRVAGTPSTTRFEPDPAPLAGTVPAAAPAYLATRALPGQPTTHELPATAARLESVFFTWIGQDPLAETPRVTLESDLDGDGHYDAVRRRSGRAVEDGDLILTWTPEPLAPSVATEQIHYWTVEWQLATPLGDPRVTESSEPSARIGLPLGSYRIRAEGAGYTVVSRPVRVTPAPLAVTVVGAQINVGYRAPTGFRLLDDRVSATGLVPLRDAEVDVEITSASGGSESRTVVLDGSGSVALTGLADAIVAVRVTDRFGNEGMGAP